MHRSQKVSQSKVRELAAHKSEHCVTISLPVFRAFPAKSANAASFNAAVERASTELEQRGATCETISTVLRPARELVNAKDFWTNQAAPGLCVLVNAEGMECYELPFECDEMVSVGNSWHIAPLLYALQWNVRFHVLALTPKAVAVFECTPDRIQKRPLPAGLPMSVDEEKATAGLQNDRGVQYHTAAGFGAGGSLVGVAHGQGDPRDERHKVLADHFREIAHRLEPMIGREGDPVVLVATERHAAAFRGACKWPTLLPDGVIGSPEEFSKQELLERAWKVVANAQRDERAKHIQRFEDLSGTPLCLRRIEEIVPAAATGRVENLITAFGAESWGTFDPGTGQVTYGGHVRGDADLINLAIRHTLLHRGDVMVVAPDEIPLKPVRAILRW